MTEIKPVVIFKVGDVPASMRERLGDFEDWIRAAVGGIGGNTEIVDARGPQDLPDPSEVSGAIITGSRAMVSEREPWMRTLMRWIAGAARNRTPVLGICFGHQLIAEALGGAVGYRTQGVEIGTVMVDRDRAATSDVLFSIMPQCFPAHVAHWQSVQRLPTGATNLAASPAEPHQAVRFNETTWGLSVPSRILGRGDDRPLGPERRDPDRAGLGR